MKTVAIKAVLDYLPNGAFEIRSDSTITIDSTDPWEIHSIHGGVIDKQSFLKILDNRRKIVTKDKKEKFPTDVLYAPVAVPISITGISESENKVVRFQLTAHVQRME